ncbi:MAG: TIR domain-containing protein [Hyphomonadaceae bacterium]
MADVFISYASEDRARVRPLAEALQERGFSVWWDRSLAAGHDYASVIERELKNAKAVIVVWTQSSAMSTFVRDEAGRARDQGRLIPVSLDAVQLPLGFGSYQAEDFTRWNGGANAPQMQLLEESVRAKIEGRDVDSAAIAAKRRRLGARIRIVSLLTVIALVVGIAAGLNNIFNPQEPEVVRTDVRAELLRLLEEGKLTPEQAIQLAEILESGALGETQMAEAAPPPESPYPGAEPAPGASDMEIRSGDNAPLAASVAVSEQEFDAAARETYQSAVTSLLRHPNPEVRRAAVQLSNPETRDAAMQTMWTHAQNNPDDPLREQIYLVCGAVGETNDNPLGQRALELATNIAPERTDTWRMLSRSYQRTNRRAEAQAAAQVSEGVEAQQQGQTERAEQILQQALPNLQAAPPAVQASVVSELGAIAEGRNDHTTASARYAQSYRLREQAAEAAPESPVAQALEADAQQLVRSLDRSGRTREACERLRQAQQEHDVAAPDQELLDRCTREFRTPLRPEVQLAPQLQRQRVTRTPVAPAEPN